MNIYIHMYTPIYMYTRTNHLWVCMYACVCMHICTYIYICIYAYIRDAVCLQSVHKALLHPYISLTHVLTPSSRS